MLRFPVFGLLPYIGEPTQHQRKPTGGRSRKARGKKRRNNLNTPKSKSAEQFGMLDEKS
jgi:hypothetical protein